MINGWLTLRIWRWKTDCKVILVSLTAQGFHNLLRATTGTPLNHFKVCSSLALSTFTILCHHRHHPCPKLFHLPKLKLCTHEILISYSFLLPAPGTHLSVSMNLVTLLTSYKWNLWYLSFCVWLILLSTMSWKFVHVVPCDRISFLFKAE